MQTRVSDPKTRQNKPTIRRLKRHGRRQMRRHPLLALQIMIKRRRFERVQLKTPELLQVVKAIRSSDSCRLLVFGLGNDSPFWAAVNPGGRTVFLEDYAPWFEKITDRFPGLEAYSISYPLNITQWEEVIGNPSKLAIDLPEPVGENAWDVIVVDGPRGHKLTEEVPGRMSSIYMASRLAAGGGTCVCP